MQTIFYGDSVLVFSAEGGEIPEGFTAVPAPGNFAKMLENLEKYKRVCVLSPEPLQAYHHFMENFTLVDAAGGVVENNQGELLMIYRNGRWDLPKGHREHGEDFPACALREVEEETGIPAGLHGEAPVCTTYHFYKLREVWLMKRTVWFPMRSKSTETVPQTVEGIARAEWIPRVEVAEKAVSCFPSVKAVLEVANWVQ